MNSLVPALVELSEGHPLQVYYEEGALIQNLLLDLLEVDPAKDHQKYFNIFNQLAAIEKRIARNENQLFPYLEKHGWNGPSRGMWSFHDNLRNQIRLLNSYNKEQNIDKIKDHIPFLIVGIKRFLTMEDIKLFPNAMQLLGEADWKEFYAGDEEIRWMLPLKPKSYPTIEQEEYIHPSQDFKERPLPFSPENTLHNDEGHMTPEQINLLLSVLLVDLTYVYENDKEIFYNRGEETVFPRSKVITGREVRFCHPPKSVDSVLGSLRCLGQGPRTRITREC